MRTDEDDQAHVRDPSFELLLSHTATVTDGADRKVGARK